MSTFSTKGGLYERAQKRFGVSDGKKLFTYSFFEKHKLEALVRCTSAMKAVHLSSGALSCTELALPLHSLQQRYVTPGPSAAVLLIHAA